MANPVKTISKHALGWTLMFFDSNGFDFMQPGTDMIGPAKSQGDNSKKPL
jgi:hypothetical protein